VEPAAPREALLREYLDILRRNRWVVLAAVIIVPAVAIMLSLAQPVRYAATARVLLNTQNLASSSLATTQQVPASPVPPDRVADTQAQLARVTTVMQRVQRSGSAAGMTIQQLLSSSSVSSDPNADLLSFTVTAATPERAEAIATAYATAFTRYRSGLDTAPVRRAQAHVQTLLTELEAQGRTGSSLYRSLQAKDQSLQSLEVLRTSNATVVQQAMTATQVQPKTARNALIGIALGLLLGIALAFLRQALDGRVVTAREVSSVLGLPLLGRLSGVPRTVRRQDALVTVVEPNSRLSQAYRVLRATIDSMMPRRVQPGQETARLIAIKQDPPREMCHLIAITSATSGEGRSTTVANLGVAFARAGRRVLLVNADMRRTTAERPTSLDRLFGLDLEVGLADIVRHQTGVDGALAHRDVSLRHDVEGPETENPAADDGLVEDGFRTSLWVLPAGSSPMSDLGDPTTSSRLDDLLEELASRFDVVLIDVPPLLLSADSLELVRRADAAVVVVRANRVAESTLAELARVLASSPVYKMGFVLTDSNEDRYTSARERFALKPPRAA
jgi:capsular polysaccharide biosynthesis protein/Mrp family chromosome partitioning ATPase